MEARQRVKLTGTNRSNGLISPMRRDKFDVCIFTRVPIFFDWGRTRSRKNLGRSIGPRRLARTVNRPPEKESLGRPGGYGEGSTPDPIPNSAVKTLSADGTVS